MSDHYRIRFAPPLQLEPHASQAAPPGAPGSPGPIPLRRRYPDERFPAARSSPATAAEPAGRGRPRDRADPEFLAKLPRAFRDRSTSPERIASLLRLSPDEIARFGIEFESGKFRIVPNGKSGDVLCDMPHGTVEIDRSAKAANRSNTECVTKPTADNGTVERGVRAFVRFFDAVRARAKPKERVRLSRVLPTVAPEHAHRSVQPQSVVPEGILQSTMGVSLADFDELLDFLPRDGHPGGSVAATVRRQARQVERLLSKTCGGIDLTQHKNLQGFIKLILYYMAEGNQNMGRWSTSTVHGAFHFVLRSDFHAVYKKLLNAEERALADVLLLPNGEDNPLLLKAIGRKHTSTFFKSAYPDYDAKRHVRGPELGAWFHSIVHGRGKGRFAKDILSPPPGYPLHTGDLDEDDGMGAMGVDAVNQKMLFEIRSHRFRKNVLLNSHLVTAVKLEQMIACRFNRAVLSDMERDLKITRHEQDWVKSSYPAIKELGLFYEEFSQLLDNKHPRRAQRKLKACRFEQLRKFRKTFDQRDWRRRYPELGTALDEFSNRIRRAREVPSSIFVGEKARAAIEALIDAMWNIDATLEEDSDSDSGEASAHG